MKQKSEKAIVVREEHMAVLERECTKPPRKKVRLKLSTPKPRLVLPGYAFVSIVF